MCWTLPCAHGEEPSAGQAKLDEAVETALEPQDLNDLGRAIRLCQESLELGLDEENTVFANQLMASTLMRRATIIGERVRTIDLGNPELQRQFPRLRQAVLLDLDRALQIDDSLAEAHLLAAQLGTMPGGDVKQAAEHLEKAITLSAERPLVKAQALAVRAKLQEDPEKRSADYDAAVELAGSDVEVRLARAEFRLGQADWEAALEDLNAALEEEPDRAEIHQLRGLALGGLGKLDDALASLDAAIRLDADSALNYVHRARVYLLKGKFQQAIEDLDKSLSMNPANLGAYLLRATVHHQLDQDEQALRDVERVLQIRPGLPEAQRMQASLWAASGKINQAVERFKQLLDDSPEDVELLSQLGLLYGMKKEIDESVATFNKAIEVAPKNADLYQNRADVLLSAGRQAEALKDYNKTLELAPDQTRVLNNLAWLLATSPHDELRDGSRALDMATKACELTQYKEAHIVSTLAAAYAEMGNFDKAIEWSKKAIELSSDKLAGQLTKELDSYEAKQPWREIQGDEASPAEDDTPVPQDEKAQSSEPVEPSSGASR
jgi:tetratricopeptide (TPR) repeat protein